MTAELFESLADENQREKLAKRRQQLRESLESLTLEQQLDRLCPESMAPTEWPTPWPKDALKEGFWQERNRRRRKFIRELEDTAITDLRDRLKSPAHCTCGCDDMTGDHQQCWITKNYAHGHPDRFKVVACRCRLVAEKGRFRDWLLQVSGLKSMGPMVPSFTAWNEEQFPEARDLKKVFVDWSQGRTNGKDWLFVQGPPGTGKSHLAMAATLAAVGRSKRAVYIDVLEFIADGRKKLGTVDGQFNEWVTSIKQAPYLAIDDIGQEYATDWTASVLREILHWRYMHAMPTIVCSNKKANELVKSLGEATVDRFNDTQLCVSIEITDGKSQRALLANGE